MPALLLGLTLSVPIDTLKPGLPEWVSALPSLLFVPALWYLIGFWMDRGNTQAAEAYWLWVSVVLVAIVSLIGAVTSGRYFGSYATFLPFGVALWAVVGGGMLIFEQRRKRALRGERSKISPQTPV